MRHRKIANVQLPVKPKQVDWLVDNLGYELIVLYPPKQTRTEKIKAQFQKHMDELEQMIRDLKKGA